MPAARLKNSHIWEVSKDSFYIEPHWCSRRLFQLEDFSGAIWDASCGSGRIVDAAKRAGFEVRASDLVKRRPDIEELDFFSEEAFCLFPNIVSNPPFHRVDEYVRRALEMARRKVALLVSATWLVGYKRSIWLQRSPLKRIWYLTPRPSMPPGAVIFVGEEPKGGTYDFVWCVWEQGYTDEPRTKWMRRDGP